MLDQRCSAKRQAHPACLQSSCRSLLPRFVFSRLYHRDLEPLSLQWQHIVCSILQMDSRVSVPELAAA